MKQVLKGTRWLLLKKPKNLDDKRNERQSLEADNNVAAQKLILVK